MIKKLLLFALLCMGCMPVSAIDWDYWFPHRVHSWGEAWGRLKAGPPAPTATERKIARVLLVIGIIGGGYLAYREYQKQIDDQAFRKKQEAALRQQVIDEAREKNEEYDERKKREAILRQQAINDVRKRKAEYEK